MRSFGSIWNRSSPGSREATWRALAERSRNANSARLPCGTRTTALTLSWRCLPPRESMVRGCGIGTGPKTDGIVPAIVSMVAMSPPANAPIRFNIVPTASRRPHTQAAANTGGSAVWARSSTSTWASIGEFHSINDRASTGSVSRSAAPVLHGSAARTATPRASIRSTYPYRRRCRTHTNWSTRRGWPRHGIRIVPDSPRAHGASAPGVAMTSCGANPISDTTPLGWLGVDSTIGTPRNSLASSIAVPAAPTPDHAHALVMACRA